jgi:presenilin-like A22 family membrane protease
MEKKDSKESWLSKEVIIKLALLFLIIEGTGIIVAINLIPQNVAQPLFSENINDPINAIGLFVMILVMTGLILLILKFRKENQFLIIIETLAIFSASIIVTAALIPNEIIAIILSLALIVFRNLYRENIFIRNFASAIAIAGAGALLGISLGLLPIILFIIILAIYDIIAVFGTKHMVALGQAVTKKNYAFTIAIPTKKHFFELGNGDLVIPLVVATSIIANAQFQNNVIVATLCLLASFLGLCSSIYMVSAKKIAMPALPPQTLLMVIILIISLIFYV